MRESLKRVATGLFTWRVLFLAAVFVPVCLSAYFMVMEAGDFYTTLYQNNTNRGYIAGVLTEVFLALSAAAYFKGRRWTNGVIKGVMVFLFFAAVTGSSFKVVVPLLDEIDQSKGEVELKAFQKLENQQNQRYLDLLKGQKTNTAIAIREARKASEEYKETLATQSRKSWLSWLLVAVSVGLRFGLQLAAVVWAHNLGVLWRDGFAISEKPKKAVTREVSTARKQPPKPPVAQKEKQPEVPPAQVQKTNERPRLVAASGGVKQ